MRRRCTRISSCLEPQPCLPASGRFGDGLLAGGRLVTSRRMPLPKSRPCCQGVEVRPLAVTGPEPERFLRFQLADGARLSNELFAAGASRGLGKRRLQRAFKAMGGVRRRANPWAFWWSLPPELPEGATVSRRRKPRCTLPRHLWLAQSSGLPAEVAGQRLGFGASLKPCECRQPAGDCCGALSRWRLGQFPCCPRCLRRLAGGWTGYSLP